MALPRPLPAICVLSIILAPASALPQAKENLDLPFDAEGGDLPDEDCIESVLFYSVPLEGHAFFYVIDRSGTMQEKGELARAKEEVLKNVQEFSERIQFGIIFFDSTMSRFPQNGRPADATPVMKQSARSFVQGTPGGLGTCGLQPLLAGIQMANLARSRRRVIVYLSDGGGTCHGANEAEYLARMLEKVTLQNFQRIRIDTIGVLDVSPLGENFLRKLASANGGTYTRI